MPGLGKAGVAGGPGKRDAGRLDGDSTGSFSREKVCDGRTRIYAAWMVKMGKQ